MAQNCELLENCGFLKKYQTTKELACREFITLYCQGPKMDECKRKEYKNTNGKSSSDDMMPYGQNITA